jgi:NAD-dependent dihydropyrimidine dehydrogenase PreA subunit
MTAAPLSESLAAGERRPYPVARLLDGQPRTILFDAAQCIGCRQCVEACKDWIDLADDPATGAGGAGLGLGPR